MTKKEQLREVFNQAVKEEKDFIAVAIKTRDSEGLETIINPRCNFMQKLEYYENAYNDNLVLKSYDGIEIVHFVAYDDIPGLSSYYIKADTDMYI